MSITILEMCDAIKSVLDDLIPATLNVVQSLDELSEGYADAPMAQIYWERTEPVPAGSDRSSFRAGVRQYDHTFNVDIPCRVRANIDEDMLAVATITETVITKLETQKVKPYFGDENIKAYSWTCQRITFNPTAAPEGPFYPGVRFVVTLRTF